MAAPNVVRVTYRNIDGVHVFTSTDVRALYVASRDLRDAYEEVAEALHDLMKFNGEDIFYSPEMSTEQFTKLIGHTDIRHPAIITEAQNVPYRRAAIKGEEGG